MDLFEKCRNFTRAAEARASGYYPYFIPLDDTEGTEVVVNGKRMIMIGSNNYLGWHELHWLALSQRQPRLA